MSTDNKDELHFEANMLDGDKVEDCGKAMLSAESVWKYIAGRDASRDQQIALDAQIKGATAFKDQLSFAMLGEGDWLKYELDEYIANLKDRKEK